MGDFDLFKSFMEADDPPDAAMMNSQSPDVPADTGPSEPPEISDDVGAGPDDMSGENPPEINDIDDGGDMSEEDPPGMGGDDFGENDGSSDDSADGNNQEPMDLDEKISAILNKNLYSRFLVMLDKLTTQMTQLKSNNDIVYAISPEASEVSTRYKELENNIRIYLRNSFLSENYSKNLLFFNKCLNLFKFLNASFTSFISKGIKENK